MSGSSTLVAWRRRSPLLLGIAALLMLGGLLKPSPGYSDGGNSITSPYTARSNIAYTSLALDATGNPVVAYYGDGDLKVLHCNDANCGGGDESVNSPDWVGDVGQYASLALDGSGNPVVSYFDDTNDDLKLLHCNDPNCEGGDESITSPDTAGAVGWHTSLALDGSGHPVVSYVEYYAWPLPGGDHLRVLHCNDPYCSGNDESITSPHVGVGIAWNTSLALDASGYPVIAHDDWSNGALSVLHCNDPNCSGNDESITSPDTDAWYTSLALDVSGNPVVSYGDWAEGGVKVLHCNDPDCSGGDESITSPDAGRHVGWWTSLALDAAGNPVVSSWDSGNYDLRVLHCNDADCSGGDESITAPDTEGGVGFYSSLAIDSSGCPVISYRGGTNDLLKVLPCGDANCSGVKPTPTGTDTPLPPVGGLGAFPSDSPSSARVGYTGELFAVLTAAGTAAAVTLSGVLWHARKGRRS